MDLLIDVGNSRIKWACADRFDLSGHGAVAWEREAGSLPAEVAAAWQQLDGIDRVLVSSVAGELFNAHLASWFKNCQSKEVSFAGVVPGQGGLTTRYGDPARLGVDRWLAMAGAFHHYQGAVWVVDCGTAVTVDAVSGEGEHLGGVIMPGLALMEQSLLSRAPGVRAGIAAGEQDLGPGLGRDTATGVRLGALHAVAGGVEHILSADGDYDFCDYGPSGAHYVITGGDGGLIRPHIKREFDYIPDLVLQGLAVIGADI